MGGQDRITIVTIPIHDARHIPSKLLSGPATLRQDIELTCQVVSFGQSSAISHQPSARVARSLTNESEESGKLRHEQLIPYSFLFRCPSDLLLSA